MTTDQTRLAITEGEDVVIFLEAQDDLGTVRSKLERVRGERVALVVPPGAHALQRGIAVRLLRRMAEGCAVDLSIVTADGELQRLAREESVPVFSSVRGFRRHVERQSQMRGSSRPSPAAVVSSSTKKIISIGSIVAVTLIILILAYVFIPTATVVLRPATEPIGETIDVRADPEARGIDYVGRRVPARAIYDSVEGTDQVPVTGFGSSDSARAEGRVTFTNRSRREIEIPAGTVVLTPDGVKFVVMETAHLPPAFGAWAQVRIFAVDPGAKGNVPRLRISQVEGPLSRDVTVLNEEPTVGGGKGDAGIVSDADLKRLRDQLFDRLSKEALGKLQVAVRKGESLPPATVKLTILNETFDRRVGEQAKALNLRMEVRVNGTAFDPNDVYTLAERAWQPRLRPGFAIVPDSVQLLPFEVVRSDGDAVILRVRVDGVAAALINEEQVNAAVRWRRAREAVDQLARSFMLAEQPGVSVEPSWASRAFRVHLIVQDR